LESLPIIKGFNPAKQTQSQLNKKNKPTISSHYLETLSLGAKAHYFFFYIPKLINYGTALKFKH